MGSYTGLDGTKGLLPTTERVWAVRKKERTDDRRSGQGKREGYEREQKRGEEIKNTSAPQNSSEEQPPIGTNEEEVGYGAAKPKKRSSGKVDLVI